MKRRLPSLLLNIIMLLVSFCAKAQWAELGGTGLSQGEIWATAVDPDGNVYAPYVDVSTTPISSYIKKWDKQTNTWGYLSNTIFAAGFIYDIETDANGNVYAAGNFSTTTTTGIVEWEKSTNTWKTDFGWSSVGVKGFTIDNRNGNIYAVGDFTDIYSNPVKYVEKWDKTTGTWSIVGGTNQTVLSTIQVGNSSTGEYKIVIDKMGNVFVGGDNGVAEWDGNTWTRLVSNVYNFGSGNLYSPSAVTALGIDEDGYGLVYSIGSDRGNNYILKWNGVNWVEQGSALPTSLFSSFPYGYRSIEDIKIDDEGTIYIAGSFLNSGGKKFVAAYDGLNWTEVGSASTNPLNANGTIHNIALDLVNKLIYTSGYFTDGSSNKYVAVYNSLITHIPIITQILNNVNICADQSSIGTTTGSLTVNSNWASSYKWQFSINGGSTWTNIDGTNYNTDGLNMTGYNGATLTVTPTTNTNTYLYRCVVTNVSGSVNSNSASVSINPNITPSFSLSPNSATSVCSVNSTNFSIVSPSNEGSSPTYQWSVTGDVSAHGTGTSFNYTNNNAGNYIVKCKLTSSIACTTPVTNSINLTVNQTPTIPSSAIISSTTQICSGPITFTAPVSSNSGITYHYTWQINGSSASGAPDAYTYIKTFTTNDVVSCQIFAINTSNGCGSTQTSNNINLFSDHTWTGAAGNHLWIDAGNWCPGTLPNMGDNIVISNLNNSYPDLSLSYSGGSTIAVGNITFNTGAQFTTGATNVLVVYGDITFNGGNNINGNLLFNNDVNVSHIINGSGTTTNLSLSEPSNTYLEIASGTGNQLNITGVLNLGTGTTLNTNDNLTLKSTINNTGVIGPVNGNINGKITVERYIPKGFKAFRELSSGGIYFGSIFDNWQEGGSTSTNYGTFVIGEHNATSGFDPSTGIDYTNANPASNGLYNYHYNTGWVPVTDTKNGYFNPFTGFHLLVYGNRSHSMYQPNFDSDPIMTSAVTLRAKGTLLTGDVSYTINGVTNAVYSSNPGPDTYNTLTDIPGEGSFIANPYPCAIDWTTLTRTNLEPTYYYFDPATSDGHSQQFTAFNISSGNSNPLISAVNQYIQPGQAFWVQADATAGAGTIELDIHESDKVTNGFGANVFKAAIPNRIITTLWKKDATNTLHNVDGAVVAFGAAFNKTIGQEDSKKFWNSGENLTIFENNKDLSIDGLPNPQVNDSIYLKMIQMTVGKPYTLRIDLRDFTAVNGMQPYLVDRIANTGSLLSTDSTFISFTPTANTNSYKDRFVIVFKPTTTLPVKFISVKANHITKGNEVSWVTANATDILNYIVESSINGDEFKQINTSTLNKYNEYYFADQTAGNGKTYYRIKAVGKDGQFLYSNIVVVNIESKGSMIVVPNPVENGNMNISFNNITKGNYVMAMYSQNGQELMKNNITINESSKVQTVSIKQNIAAGIYTIKLLGTDFVTNVIIK